MRLWGRRDAVPIKLQAVDTSLPRKMQGPSQAETEKSSSLTISCRWLCPWLPADHDVRHILELRVGYQTQLLRLMFAVRSLGLWKCFPTSLSKIAGIRSV